MNMKYWSLISFLSLFCVGCVTPADVTVTNFVLEEDGEFPGNSDIPLVWSYCKQSNGLPLVAVIAPAVDKEKISCSDWRSQVVLAANYNVLFLAGNFIRDFGGEASQKVVGSFFESKDPKKELIGIWGYGLATVPAAFQAKSRPSLKWVLLGDGIYDTEFVYNKTKSVDVKAAIKDLQASGSDEFFEQRSIDWDFDGLKCKVLMYHTDWNREYPLSQAQAFRDNLASQEIAVSLKVVRDPEGKFSEVEHKSIVSGLLPKN